MTPFALLLRLSGLSQKEAAELLKMSPSSVDKFSRGVMTPKRGVLRELRDLIDRQVESADRALSQIDDVIDSQGEPDEIVLGYPADRHEAEILGWPNVGAWWGMAAHVVASSDLNIVFRPRGSDLATAGAIDAHEKTQRRPK